VDFIRLEKGTLILWIFWGDKSNYPIEYRGLSMVYVMQGT